MVPKLCKVYPCNKIVILTLVKQKVNLINLVIMEITQLTCLKLTVKQLQLYQ